MEIGWLNCINELATLYAPKEIRKGKRDKGKQLLPARGNIWSHRLDSYA